MAFILLFTSQFTVLKNHLCALDTTLRNTDHMIQTTCYEIILVFWGAYVLVGIFSTSFIPGNYVTKWHLAFNDVIAITGLQVAARFIIVIL